MRIALVEDDDAQARQMISWLRQAGHAVHWYDRGAAFNQAIQRESFDMIILDWNLPDGNGLDILRQFKETESKTAVLFVTSRDAESDIVAALSGGADDYLVKPTREAETLARVASVLRRTHGQTEQGDEAYYPPFVLNHQHFTVMRGEELVRLTPKEYELAWFMFRNHGRLLSRNHILESVWGLSSDLSTRTVDMHISKLRRKLGLRPEQGWRLVSVYQYGYRLESIDEPSAESE